MPQPFSSIPGFSSWGDLAGLLQAQNRLLEQLPTTLRTLTEVLEKIAPAANDAVETVTTSRRVTARVEALVDELEQPLRDLIPAANDAVETVSTSRRVTERVEALVEALERPIRDLIPAIEKITAVLNDPAIAALPATVQRVNDEVHPILDRLSSLRGAAANTGRRARQVVDSVADRARREKPVQDESRD